MATSVLVREGRLPSCRDPDTLTGHSVGVPDPKPAPRPVESGVEKAQLALLSLWLVCAARFSPGATGETLPPSPKLVVTPEF